MSDGVLAWLSVWSVVQMIFIWSRWCHCHPSSLASVKSRMVYLSGASLPRLSWKRPLNVCVCVCVCSYLGDQMCHYHKYNENETRVSPVMLSTGLALCSCIPKWLYAGLVMCIAILWWCSYTQKWLCTVYSHFVTHSTGAEISILHLMDGAKNLVAKTSANFLFN